MIPLVASAASQWPHAPFVVETGGSVFTFAEFEQAVAARADQLSKRDAASPTIIAIDAIQTIEFLVELFAMFESGLTPALLSPRLPAPLRDTHLRSITPASPPDSLPDQSIILFTSGSGGDPKGVLLTLDALAASASAAASHLSYAQGRTWGAALPLYHVGGFAIVIRALVSGGAVRLIENQTDIPALVKAGSLTHCSLVPTQLRRLLTKLPSDSSVAARLSILLGGGSLSHELLIEAASRGFRVFTSYGMTETGSVCVIGEVSADRTIRQPFRTTLLPSLERMVSSEGELLLRGQALFSGYVSASGVTKPCADGGWFATGDLAQIESGVLRIIGRIDSRFKSAGETIYPEMIERSLIEITEITQAVVVPVEDAEYGFRPVAFVQTNGVPLVVESTTRWNELLRKQLPGLMIPIRYFSLSTDDWGLEIKPRRTAMRAQAAALMAAGQSQ